MTYESAEQLALALGFTIDRQGRRAVRRGRRRAVSLALLAAGIELQPGRPLSERRRGIVDAFRARARLLASVRCPADSRIESFLCRHLADLKLDFSPTLPAAGIVLFQHGIARELSVPRGPGHRFESPLLKSYRVRNGVLHNPKADRRTTAGTFHVAEGGLPVPADKVSVPKRVFAELLRHAVNPPPELLALPYHARPEDPSRSATQTWVSLLLRPTVCPNVPRFTRELSMEVRFFAPGSLVSNLDFVESIFGNAGDPFLPENDASLDVLHWSGHTGCVILAPHLVQLTKKQLGLPHVSEATDRQRRDGMCWHDEKELYNHGTAFKVTCRTDAGIVVTLIADNYFGYCKKEVKTQISYAANLLGNVEEEHAGGAIAFPAYSFGDEFIPDHRHSNGRTFADVLRTLAGRIDVDPGGYARDRRDPRLHYVPEHACASVRRQEVFWKNPDGTEQSLLMEPGHIYMLPSGFQLQLQKHPGADRYRIVGVRPDGTFCHKPCTVSGGGKSEISKSLQDYMLYGPIFVADLATDLKLVDDLIRRDYSDRWRDDAPDKPDYTRRPSRPILSPLRSLGSVIKLLTPSEQYTDDYNEFLARIPEHIRALVFVVKRFYQPAWGDDWKSHFSVDSVNGGPGHELKLDGRKLIGSYLRVGFTPAGGWRTFKLRPDFAAAVKIQTEDDITASVVVPPADPSDLDKPSLKHLVNCEYRLFQRPDDAIHPGLDRQTERDLATDDNFLSNFEPLPIELARRLAARVTELSRFTPPMRRFIREIARDQDGYFVCSSQPRLIDGKPSKNPRYLQTRPDLLMPLTVLAHREGLRLWRGLPGDAPVPTPVDAVLTGRRNNPPDPAGGIRALAVFNPIHYQEIPELFMDFVASLTGRSPSTTGAGSEGALTKGPFNMLRPTADLNAALVSYLLTGLGGFTTAGGYVGPKVRVDHDISLLVPELWCRLSPHERDPRFLIANGYLEKLNDFDHNGQTVLASRLGYRITSAFVRAFFGRLFDFPSAVFDDAMLRPETQDLEIFVDGVNNITQAQQWVARQYFEDGTIDDAVPPLQVLLHIMAFGHWQGKDAHHPDVRAMFTREAMLASDWYHERLRARQRADVARWTGHVSKLRSVLARPPHATDPPAVGRMPLQQRLREAEAELERVRSEAYLGQLRGTLGTDPTLVCVATPGVVDARRTPTADGEADAPGRVQVGNAV